MLEGQNLMCNYNKKPRFWTEEERVLAAEARKAEVASEDTLLIPRPPSYIGKEA